jgi:hypothetical protein
MDKSKTIEELKKNYTAAKAADDAYAAEAAKAAKAAKAAYYAAYAATAAYGAYAAYDADYAYAEYWLNEYFERTGENREDYENKIKEK